MTDEERFWRCVEPEPNSGCWLWSGLIYPTGYGLLWANGKQTRAHRYSFWLHGGIIPDGMVIDHLCRVPSCVNPRHLEVVSQRVNTLRGVGPAAANAKRDTCQRGHRYDRFTRAGTRRCRQCDNLQKYAWRAAIRALATGERTPREEEG